MSGTPKTLDGAIEDGVRLSEGCSRDAIVACVEMHVRDFLAQHFTGPIMDQKGVDALWARIVALPKPPEDSL